MTNRSTCPICSSTDYKRFLELKDHSVTKENFEILECQSCHLLQTHPIPKDLDRYYESSQYISHADKPSTLIDRVYFHARSYTLAWKEGLINKTAGDNKTLLDYGCGTGTFLKYCLEKNWSITGVEPSEQARTIAKNNTKASIEDDIRSVHQSNFGIITLWHVLEHLINPNETLQLLKQKLGKTGTMFIAVPNYKSKDAEHYSQYWAAYDVPRHIWHFSKSTMQQLICKQGLKIESIIPMKLDAYYVAMLSEKYKHDSDTTFSTLLTAIREGTISNLNAKKTGEYSSLIYVIKHESV